MLVLESLNVHLESNSSAHSFCSLLYIEVKNDDGSSALLISVTYSQFASNSFNPDLLAEISFTIRSGKKNTFVFINRYL